MNELPYEVIKQSIIKYSYFQKAMQQIIITYNRLNSSIIYKKVQDQLDQFSPPQYPSTQPGIVAFYKNRQRHLDFIQRQQKNQYEGYPALETPPTQNHFIRFDDFQDHLTQNPSESSVSNQQSHSYLSPENRFALLAESISKDHSQASFNSFTLQDIITDDTYSSPSLQLNYNSKKQLDQISLVQEPVYKNLHHCSQKGQLKYYNSFNDQPSTFLSEQTSIQVSSSFDN